MNPNNLTQSSSKVYPEGLLYNLQVILMADLHYRIMWLLPCPSGGQLVLFHHTKCMGNDYRGR